MGCEEAAEVKIVQGKSGNLKLFGLIQEIKKMFYRKLTTNVYFDCTGGLLIE
jgi:hypothetical protein